MELSTLTMDFMGAALPWILLGLGVAFAAVAYNLYKKGESHLTFAGVATIAFAFALFGFNAPCSAHAVTLDSFDTIAPKGISFTLGDDMIWTGKGNAIKDVEAPNDLLGAGQDIRVEGCTFGGSLRLAGQDLFIDKVTVGHSITLAGQDVFVAGSNAQAIALCAQDASFDGETNDLWITSATATINGTIHGDVHVWSETLTIGPDAVIEGTLHATLAKDPAGINSASIGALDVTIEDRGEDYDLVDDLTRFTIFGLIASALFTLAMAALVEWLARRQTRQSVDMVKATPGRMLGTGAIGALVAPIFMVILMITVIGIPLSVALFFALLALQIVALGFASASLGKIAFPKLGRFPAALAMGAILGAASSLPFVGWLLPVAAFVYLLGYVLQKVYLGMTSKPDSHTPTMPESIAAPTNSSIA